MEVDDFDQRTQAFTAWFISAERQRAGTYFGPDSSSAHISSDAGPLVAIVDKRTEGRGRAVIALQDIPEDTLLFRISHADILTFSTSSLHSLLPESTKIAVLNLPPWLSLVLTLLHEAGQGISSSWAPYLSLLPVQLDTLMYWTKAELAELQGSHVVRKIGKDDAEEAFREHIWPIVRAHPQHFGSYAEAFAQADESAAWNSLCAECHRFATVIMAYAFDLDLEDAEEGSPLNRWATIGPSTSNHGPTDNQSGRGDDNGGNDDEDSSFIEETSPPKGMVPFSDLLNASGSRNNARLFHGPDHVSMVSIAPITAGEEVFNDYGPLPSAEILRCYGYVDDAYRPFDVVELETNNLAELATKLAGAGAGLSERKVNLAEQWDVLDESYDLARIEQTGGEAEGEMPMDEALVLVTTLLVANEAEIKELRKEKKQPKPKLSEQVVQVLIRAIQKRQADYTTSIAEDMTLLQSGELATGSRRWMAVKVRLGEKEVLAQNLEYLQQRSERKKETATKTNVSEDRAAKKRRR